MGIGWTSDAHHFTHAPRQETIVRAMRRPSRMPGFTPEDIQHVNAHGTSTHKGDAVEAACLREVFGSHLEHLPISANKSQVGHSLGAAAAIEAVLGIEAMRRQATSSHGEPSSGSGDSPISMWFPMTARSHSYENFLSNAFGFGGTNCCIVFKGV